MTLLIDIQDLVIQTDQSVLLEKLSCRLYQGRPLTILGETGSGKSLLAQAIMGVLPSSLSMTGTVRLFGHTADASERRQYWGTRIAMLPQEPWNALDPLMCAHQQIAEVYQCVHHQSTSAARSQALLDLEQLGLRASAQKRVHQLSGGMAQRLAFAAATAGGAQLILADEPTKGLDISRRNEVVQLLLSQSNEGGLLTITHDVEVARQLGGDIMVIKAGQLLEQGPATDVLSQPQHDYTRALIAAEPTHWPPLTLAKASQNLILSVNEVQIERQQRLLFRPISFELHQGEIIGVAGDSGCGKSSLGDALLGLLPIRHGTITRHATAADRASAFKWQKLYQDPPSAFSRSVTLGQLLEDVVTHHRLDPQRILPLLQRLKLAPDLLNRDSHQVSGGELQRFALLRMLLLDPLFLFADEPTSRLDPITAKEVTYLLAEMAREHHCAMLFVSHDIALLNRICDRVIRLESVEKT